MKVKDMGLYKFIMNSKEFESIDDIRFILVSESGRDLLEEKNVFIGKTLPEVLDEYKGKDLENLKIHIYRNSNIITTEDANTIKTNDGNLEISLLNAINNSKEIIINMKADYASFLDGNVNGNIEIRSKYIRISPEDYPDIIYDYICTTINIINNKTMIHSYFTCQANI